MSEGAMQLGGEHELRIDFIRAAHPEAGDLRFDVSVERRIDFYHVETAGEDFQGMLFAALHSGRVEDALPVFVGPAGGAHANLSGFHDGPSLVRSQGST